MLNIFNKNELCYCLCMDKIIIVIIIGYFLGYIQASYLLAKIVKNVDIRTLGYGNAGMSNTVESLG